MAGDSILMGKRKDTLLYTCPGGCKEVNETEHQCAIRELFEETGIRANPDEIVKIGQTFNDSGVIVHAYKMELNNTRVDSREITTKYDPDDEVFEWEWIRLGSPKWETIKQILQYPIGDNVLFKHLGIE